jgi:hypothetical protein
MDITVEALEMLAVLAHKLLLENKSGTMVHLTVLKIQEEARHTIISSPTW